MSSDGSEPGTKWTLSLAAQFDDINRLNNVLNDGAVEECFLAYVKQTEWVRAQWAASEAEAARLQTELDEALHTLSKWEAKFAHVRKMLDGEKRERNIVLKKYNEVNKLLDLARDLLFKDNRTKLNDETLNKLAFLNGTAQQDLNTKINGANDLNSTGTLLSEMSYSRSEDDLDESMASAHRSWAHRGSWAVRENPPANKKRRSSTNSSATKTVELQGGKVLATATTTLTLERAPTSHDLKPPQNFQPISESSDEAATPRRKSSRRSDRTAQQQQQPQKEFTPTAPPKSDTESASDAGRLPQRTPSVVSAGFGSPRTRPRQHNFVAKTFYKREICAPCGKPIGFAKLGVRCENCRAPAHADCRALLPLPCVPPGRAPHSQEGSISDYAPSTPPMVPALLVHCVNEIEKRGLSERGIYRISAVDKEVKRLKERFLRGHGSPQLGSEDINVICGCVKDFLRSLREPLVSSALWADFIAAAALAEPGDAAAAIVQAVSQLPQPNRDTLAFLMLHLQKVAESPDCEMGVENLARIFGPNVVGYGLVTQAPEMYAVTAQMANVMQVMLRLPGDYWSQWACPGDASPRHQHNVAAHKPRGFFFSPADNGVSRKKRNFF